MNGPYFSLDHYTSGSMDLQITQNLLQGFGAAVNGRNIRVQKNNVKVTDLQFKQQVITTVSAALNLYWDLVAFDEDVRARQEEVKAAEQLKTTRNRSRLKPWRRLKSRAPRPAIRRPAGSYDFADQSAAAGDSR